MYLNVAFILYEFSNYSVPPKIVYKNLTNQNEHFSIVKFFREEEYDDDTLYLATFEDIKSGARLPKLMIISGIRQSEMIDGFVYIDLSRAELYNAMISLAGRYFRIESDLYRAVVKNESLKIILNICAQFFDNPVCLIDMHLRLIETSDITGKNSLLGYLKSGKVKSDKSRNVVFSRQHEIPSAYFISNIFVDGELTASLTIHEVLTPLHESQMVVVEQITKTIEECLKNRNGQLNVKANLDRIVLDIIDGHHYNNDVLKNILKQLNWTIDEGFLLVIVQKNEDNPSNDILKHSYVEIHRFFPGSYIIETEDFAIILVCASKNYDLGQSYEKLKSSPENKNFKVIVSRFFRNFNTIYDYFQTTFEALKIAKRIQPLINLYYYDDYAYLVLLKMASQQFDLTLFCTPESIVLNDYDIKHDRDFFRSLYVYLTQNKSLTAASGVLNIHSSTLFYRIGRASDIAKVDLSNSNICSALIRSYEILRFRANLMNT